MTVSLLVLTGCGDDGDLATEGEVAAADVGPDIPESVADGGETDGGDLEQQILEGMSDEDLPEGFPDVPLPQELQVTGVQQTSSGSWQLYGDMFDADRLAVIAEVQGDLESDGWTTGALEAAERDDTMDGFLATKGEARYEFSTVGAPGSRFSVLVRLVGFEI